MQAALRAPVVLRSLMLAVVGVLPLDLVAESAQAPRAPAAETPPANLDTLKARDQELEALRAEQRRTLENEARLKREIESIGDDPEQQNSRQPEQQRTENDGGAQGDLHELVVCKNGSTEMHSYDWHRIKTRGKVFAIGGRANRSIFCLFYAGMVDHAR